MPPTKPKPETDLTPNRMLVAVITLACFGIAAAMWYGGYSKEQQLSFSGLIRVGIFMGAFWLALPSKSRFAAWKGLSPWVVVCIAVGIFFLPRLKYSIPLFLGMLVLLVFIKPRKKKHQPAKQTIEVKATQPPRKDN
jgi:hypothetical protein